MACDADTHMCNAISYLGKGTLDLKKQLTLGEYLTTTLTALFERMGRTVITFGNVSSEGGHAADRNYKEKTLPAYIPPYFQD